jgi:hypothetical protein
MLSLLLFYFRYDKVATAQLAIGGLAYCSRYGTFRVDEEAIYLFFQVRWYLSHREVGLQ